MRQILIAAMAADLLTWALVPEPVRAAAESNPMAISFLAAVLLKFAAILAIFGLLTRLKHHRWVAVLLVVAITLIGAGSNLRAVGADGPSHPEPITRWALVTLAPTLHPVRNDGATPVPSEAAGASVSGHSISGVPTWFCKAGVSRCTHGHPDGPGVDLYAAAGPSLRVGDWRGRLVTVCAKVCLRIELIDFCACPAPHFLDLYWDAWNALGRPSRAVVSW